MQDDRITRRDFLNGTLLASGAVLLHQLTPVQLLAQSTGDDFTGPGGIGDYAHSNGNTEPIVKAGHGIRDGLYETLANVTDTGETYGCVIVGGGISGLAAALLFRQATGDKLTSLILENHPIFGGEAKQNEFEVDGQRLTAHQGSAVFWVPYPYSFIGRFYDSIGLRAPRFEYQKWGSREPELPLSKTPYDMIGDMPKSYGFYFGKRFGQPAWLIDPWGKQLAGAPITPAQKADLLKWRTHTGKRPRIQYHGDPISRQLDSISLEDHMIERFGITRETIRTFLAPVEGGGSGLGPDALSAYAEYAADLLHPLPDDDGDQMFPGGNTGIARHMIKTLIPNSIAGENTIEGVNRGPVNFEALDRAGQSSRMRLNATVVAVEHEGDPRKAQFVNVSYIREGKLYRVRARSVVIAGGCWTAKHIVRDLPQSHRDAYDQFYRSACLMANVAVRNWRFLYKMGITGCRWFEGIGNYTEVRKLPIFGAPSPTIGPDSPVVLNLKILYSYPGLPTQEQGIRGRTEMIGTSYRQYERQIRDQFTEMFAASGFDAKRDIAGIILNRWGHAYLNPQPGFFFGKDGKPAPGDVLRGAPFGRITFANTDLAGIMDHRTSILEADRAVRQLLDQVLV
ncbi:MAG TPA: FAD/NAD(P)-binding protein [Candidatus Koribacter sp.]|jgi:spermidine dehydrogenase